MKISFCFLRIIVGISLKVTTVKRKTMKLRYYRIIIINIYLQVMKHQIVIITSTTEALRLEIQKRFTYIQICRCNYSI